MSVLTPILHPVFIPEKQIRQRPGRRKMHFHSLRFPSSVATPATMWTSRSSTAASATPTSTRRATSGTSPIYPCVPGHEIVGRVTAVGSDVKKFKVGDLAAVGCMVDSCRTCPSCQTGWSNSASNSRSSPTTARTSTSAASPSAATPRASSWTRLSRCSSRRLNLAAAAPLLCAGITTYSPLRHWNVGGARKSASSASAALATWA